MSKKTENRGPGRPPGSKNKPKKIITHEEKKTAENITPSKRPVGRPRKEQRPDFKVLDKSGKQILSVPQSTVAQLINTPPHERIRTYEIITGAMNKIVPGDVNIDVDQSYQYERQFIAPMAEEIQEINSRMFRNRAVNRQWCYDHCAVAQTAINFNGKLIAGTKIIFKSDDEEAEEMLNEYGNNLRGEVQPYNTTQLVMDLNKHAFIHKEAVFKKNLVTETETGLKRFEIWPIDQRTLTLVQHTDFGWKKWVQNVWAPNDQPKTKALFESKDYNPVLMNVGFETKIHFRQLEPRQILMKDVVNYVGFDDAPIRTLMEDIVHLVNLKKYMTIHSKNNAIPIKGVKITGDIPGGSDESANAAIEIMADIIALTEEGSTLIFPPGWEPVQFSQQAPVDFVRTIEFLQKNIVMNLGASMSLFEASGVEIATSRVVQSTIVRSAKAKRHIYETTLRKQLFDQFLALNDKEGVEYEIVFPQLIDDSTSEMVVITQMLLEMNVVNEMEIRKLISGEIGIKDLTAEEFQKRLDQIRLDDEMGEEPPKERPSIEDEDPKPDDNIAKKKDVKQQPRKVDETTQKTGNHPKPKETVKTKNVPERPSTDVKRNIKNKRAA